MRFLLELVPCCGSPTPTWRKAPGSTTPTRPESEDDDVVRSLVPPPPPLWLRKRARTVAWSPSLGAISEDRAVVAVQRKVAVSVGSVREGTGRRTSDGGSSGAGRARAPDRDRSRRDRDEQEDG